MIGLFSPPKREEKDLKLLKGKKKYQGVYETIINFKMRVLSNPR